jgi:hypothetical protein
MTSFSAGSKDDLANVPPHQDSNPMAVMSFGRVKATKLAPYMERGFLYRVGLLKAATLRSLMSRYLGSLGRRVKKEIVSSVGVPCTGGQSHCI